MLLLYVRFVVIRHKTRKGVTAAYGSYSADLGNMNAQYVNCVLVIAVP